MSTFEKVISGVTIEAVARSFYRESFDYGFKQVDYLKFVNRLLDISINHSTENNDNRKDQSESGSMKIGPNLKFPIWGERIRIREFNLNTEKKLIEKWVTDENGRYFLLSRTTAQRSNIDELVSNPRNIVGIITIADSTPIGLVAFLDYDAEQRKAELRKLIGEPEYREKGLAKEATKYWIQYGLFTLGLKKIYLNTLDTNLRNVKLNEELGFKVEGILRNECYFDGEYHDILRMGLFFDELDPEAGKS